MAVAGRAPMPPADYSFLWVTLRLDYSHSDRSLRASERPIDVDLRLRVRLRSDTQPEAHRVDE